MKKVFCIFSILLCAVSMMWSQPRSFRLLGKGEVLKNSEVFSEYGKYEIEVEWNGTNLIVKAPQIGVLTMSNNFIVKEDEEPTGDDILLSVGMADDVNSKFLYAKLKRSPENNFLLVVINNDNYIWSPGPQYYEDLKNPEELHVNLSNQTFNKDEVVKFLKSLKGDSATPTK